MEKKRLFAVVFIATIIACCGFSASAQQVVGVTTPSVPGGVAASVSAPLQVSISWSASTESSGTVEGYYVYRNSSQITITAGTSMIDSGLLPGVYVYTIAAYDANGNVSNQSSPVSVVVVADKTPPSTPTGVTISGATSTDSAYAQIPLTISWSASTDNVGVAGYYVYRNRVQIVTSTTAFTGTSLTDFVTPGTYTYTVIAYDASQNFSDQSAPATITVVVDNTPPSIPTNISAQQVSATGINLSWATSTDSAGGIGYQIFRNGAQIASVAGPPYADSGLSAGATYTYAVAAYDSAGNISEWSPTVQLYLQSITGPSVPDIYSAVLLGTSTVRVSWAPSFDSLAITGYSVYRNGTQIASVTSTSYLDEGVATGTYGYAVSATDVSGAASAISEPTNVLISGVSPPPAVTSQISPAIPGVATGSPTASSSVLTFFNQYLYFGLHGPQVQQLQSLFVKHGYLAEANATGFFGTITLHALQKFQCDQNIVCTGGAGWGTVGPKTRSALNALEGGASELQMLQAELLNLERQMK